MESVSLYTPRCQTPSESKEVNRAINVHRNHKFYLGGGEGGRGQGVNRWRNPHWLKCCFTSTETVGLLGTGAQDVHLDFHTALR